jgi:ABC-2 type transport system permease protein
MTLWRLEWLRLVRTKRWLALFGVFAFFGLLGPLTARYLADIVTFAGGDLEGATIQFPPPVPSDGMAQYTSNAMQIGTLVAVVIASGSLAFDAIPEMGTFLRTRVPDVRRILAPRLVVTVATVVAAFVVGAGLAWYETWALIGAPDAGPVLAGIGYGVLFLVWVVALVAAVAGRASSVLGTVMTSIVVLLVLPIFGISEAVGRWLPTHLGGALGALPAGALDPSEYLGATAVTVVTAAALLWAAAALAERREL